MLSCCLSHFWKFKSDKIGSNWIKLIIWLKSDKIGTGSNLQACLLKAFVKIFTFEKNPNCLHLIKNSLTYPTLPTCTACKQLIFNPSRKINFNTATKIRESNKTIVPQLRKWKLDEQGDSNFLISNRHKTNYNMCAMRWISCHYTYIQTGH